MTDKEIIANLKREIRIKDQALREKNLALDTMHYIWCTGCEEGAHRWSDNNITEDIVKKAKEITSRLETWWENHHNREINNGYVKLSDKELLNHFYWGLWNPIKYYIDIQTKLIKDENLKEKTRNFLNGILKEIERFFK